MDFHRSANFFPVSFYSRQVDRNEREISRSDPDVASDRDKELL
jgi:hypothetical protein